MTLVSGQRVTVRTSGDRFINKRAVTPVVEGTDFPVVWVCREEEWEAARTEGREPHATPWPASAIQPLSD